jgi:TfoX/Sxy family transcriptional regulator of competence genes
MAYDHMLAQQVREVLCELPGFCAKEMFGGIGFLLHGNMACGVIADDLIVRVGPERYSAALHRPGARVFDKTGRPMTGWVRVAPAGFATADELCEWVGLSVKFTQSLPAK